MNARRRRRRRRRSATVIYRLVCPRCRNVFLRTAPAEEERVACPRCGETFEPKEEELADPEDD